MATDTGFGKVKVFEDFLGPAVDETNDWLPGTSGTGSTSINIDDNGYQRITTGTTTGNIESTSSTLIWEPENGGPLTFEARVKSVTDILTRAYFIGFSDVAQGTTLQNPIEMSGTTLTTTAPDAVGFMYDTAADNDYWYLVGVKADADATSVNTEIAPTITDQTLRVVVNEEGDAKFFIDGKYVGEVKDAVTASDKLCATVLVENRSSTTARSLDIDYLYIEGGRS